MFHNHEKHITAKTTPTNLTLLESPQQLLANTQHQTQIQQITQYCALTEHKFADIGLDLIHTIAHYYQHLPDTNGHYLRTNGLIDYTIMRTEAALALFKKYYLTEENTHHSVEQQRWIYALFSGSLLQGIGKLMISYKISLIDTHHTTRLWNQLLGPATANDRYYNYEWTNNVDAATRQRITILLAQQLMPTAGFSWIAQDAAVLNQWLALLAEDEAAAGTFGAILERAKIIAIQHEIQTILTKSQLFQPDKLTNKLGRFIHTPQDTLTNVQQLALGAEFVEWLKQELANGNFLINQYPYFMLIPGGLLMSQLLFKRFAEQHAKYKNETMIKDAFLALNIHELNTSGNLFSRFEHAKNNKMLSGIVVNTTILPDHIHFYNANDNTTTKVSTIELMHRAEHNLHTKPLEHLDNNGKWVAPKQTLSFIQPGIKPRG